MVVLDIAHLADRAAWRIPLVAWFRLRRVIENTPAILLVLSRTPQVRQWPRRLWKCARARRRGPARRASRACCGKRAWRRPAANPRVRWKLAGGRRRSGEAMYAAIHAPGLAVSERARWWLAPASSRHGWKRRRPHPAAGCKRAGAPARPRAKSRKPSRGRWKKRGSRRTSPWRPIATRPFAPRAVSPGDPHPSESEAKILAPLACRSSRHPPSWPKRSSAGASARWARWPRCRIWAWRRGWAKRVSGCFAARGENERPLVPAGSARGLRRVDRIGAPARVARATAVPAGAIDRRTLRAAHGARPGDQRVAPAAETRKPGRACGHDRLPVPMRAPARSASCFNWNWKATLPRRQSPPSRSPSSRRTRAWCSAGCSFRRRPSRRSLELTLARIGAIVGRKTSARRNWRHAPRRGVPPAIGGWGRDAARRNRRARACAAAFSAAACGNRCRGPRPPGADPGSRRARRRSALGRPLAHGGRLVARHHLGPRRVGCRAQGWSVVPGLFRPPRRRVVRRGRL